jgi:hypothetical protein
LDSVTRKPKYKPTNTTAARNKVVKAWEDVKTYYDQASYKRQKINVTVTNNWYSLAVDFNKYIDGSVGDDTPNIRKVILVRLDAEAAQFAIKEGFKLDDFQVMATVVNLNGFFIRGWGGMNTRQNFEYKDTTDKIDIKGKALTATHDIYLIEIGENADWGRFAHELGHVIISLPKELEGSIGAAWLKEDVYKTDLIDPTVATAERFDLMGWNDDRPLFSAYNMDRLGFYDPKNIMSWDPSDPAKKKPFQWDRNPHSHEFNVMAHGSIENTDTTRYHLVKLHVTTGLDYYVEVRQKPGTTAQVFDAKIPLDGTPQEGGVVVTKVITDKINMNQQMRFVTLLHDAHVLKKDGIASDPARALKITVVDDKVVTRPLVCRVRVEWAKGISADPKGAFNLHVEPWDGNYQTPDIWVDRAPFGSFDQSSDAQGRPQGNGDKPKPMEINHFWARIHCDVIPGSTVKATNVQVTFYSIFPPGVGDNGNWAPMRTVSIPSIDPNSHKDIPINWTPLVGQHTCLKVWAEQQFGENTGGDNSVQENIFEFEAASHSVPDPVMIPVAVRNPLKKRTIVFIGVKGVAEGFKVHFPHSWVWLDPLEERKFELTVIPIHDYKWYQRRNIPYGNVRVEGNIPRSYKEETLPGVFPPSRMLPIGGITAKVIPKQSVEVKLKEDLRRSTDTTIALIGTLSPAMARQILRIDIVDPEDRLRVLESKTDSKGHFAGTFDLTIKPSLEAHPNTEDIERPLEGIYKAQALVINSPNAAEAKSNIVYMIK